MRQPDPQRILDIGFKNNSTSLLHVNLPLLPSIIRYHDDFSGETRSVRTNSEVWSFRIDAENKSVDWLQFETGISRILKYYIHWSVSKHDASSVMADLIVISAHPLWVSTIIQLFFKSLDDVKNTWELQIRSNAMSHQALFARRLSMFMCDYELGNWGANEKEFIKGWAWFPSTTKYQKTEYWQFQNLSVNEVGKIQTYFDTLAQEASNSVKSVDNETYRAASIFYWCVYNAFRPMQIACLDFDDVIVRTNELKTNLAVHATFYMSKQRKGSEKMPMPRKIKSSWAILMAKWHEYRTQHSASFEALSERKNSFFGLAPRQVSLSIMNTSKQILGRTITPTMFRHFAAQRCVDSGASQLMLAEFMGHKDIPTGLIYFENSPTQASKVNAALGLSPVYRKVSDIAARKYISKDELQNMPDDNQVGGANHGIAFAGIGGCQIGQSVCHLNPAINCYTCPKFLPLNNQSVHLQIRSELQSVVESFVEAGRNDDSNPAFMQLKHTLEMINSIVESLESSTK